MIIFKSSKDLEELEVGTQSGPDDLPGETPRGEPAQEDPLTAKSLLRGQKKCLEPLHRNKRLRIWPGEQTRKEIYREVYSQETGLPATRETLEEWRQTKAEEVWKNATESLSEEGRTSVLHEYCVTHIANLVANTIHLEGIYTTLKPLGERQWALASKGLKELTQEENLATITEQANLVEEAKKEGRIPDWIKGAIIYLSLQGSRAGQEALNTKSSRLPESEALKGAACWVLGGHLSISGQPRSLEETTELFRSWTTRRKEINLQLVRIPATDIPEEISVPCPKVNGGEVPWALGWRILPILEKEIRELANKFLNNQAYFETISKVYKKKFMDRWVSNVARRGYLRKYEEEQSISERWKARTMILDPIDNYIPSKRITAPCEVIRLMAKTEGAWILLTDNLPEPEA
jgi:hypothetical protein